MIGRNTIHMYSVFYLMNSITSTMLWLAALLITVSSQYKIYNYAAIHAVSFVFAERIDTKSDDSITRYVWPDEPLSFLKYKPVDLVDLNKAPFIRVQGGIGQMRKEAFEHLADMAFHFYRVFRKRLVVVSSYRSYGLQNALFAGYIESNGQAAATFSALPGHSEHQLGLAADLFTANTDSAPGYESYYDWLRDNAHKWGFVQSYQKGAKIDGYIVEPWHWRYVGKDLATWLHISGLTFAEWARFYEKGMLTDKR